MSFDLTPSVPAQASLLILPPVVIASQYFSQAIATSHQAVYVASLWHFCSTGEHHDQPAPTLRQLLYPAKYPLPPAYTTQPEDHHLTALADAFSPMTAAETFSDVTLVGPPPTPVFGRASPPSTHTPQDHPGDEWFFNHPSNPRYYPLIIPHDGRQVKAKYIRYRRFLPYPEIDGTMGRGQLVHTDSLRLPDHYRSLTIMTRPQQRIFDIDTAMAAEVSNTLVRIDDWPLQGEVEFYRNMSDYLCDKHEQMRTLRAQIADATREVTQSIQRLSQANAYARVQDVLNQEDDAALWVANAPLRAHLSQINEAPEVPNDTPEVPNDTLCHWCQHSSHDTHDCIVFVQCTYCSRYGHRLQDCFTPHKNCQTECLIPPSHPRYARPCPLRPVSPEGSADRHARRARRVAERIDHRADRRRGRAT